MYVKIRHFFETIRGESLGTKDLQNWADSYSKLVKDDIIKAESVRGSKAFF